MPVNKKNTYTSDKPKNFKLCKKIVMPVNKNQFQQLLEKCFNFVSCLLRNMIWVYPQSGAQLSVPLVEFLTVVEFFIVENYDVVDQTNYFFLICACVFPKSLVAISKLGKDESENAQSDLTMLVFQTTLLDGEKTSSV